MKSKLNPDVLIALATALVGVAAHVVLVPVGLALHNGEWATFLLVADAFRDGYRAGFPFQQYDYGGLTLTGLRAVFTWAYDSLYQGLWLHERGHMLFSYIVTPALLSMSCFLCLRAYFDRRTSFAAGLVTAVGFGGWTYNFGNEFYPLMLITALISFALCAGLKNPLGELNRRKLLFLGFFLGQALYATRASKLFVLALLVPWTSLPPLFKFLLNILQGRLKTFWGQVTAARIGLTLFVFGLYLEIFGRNVGLISGKMLKMDGDPNFPIAAVFFGIAVLPWLRSHIKMQYLSAGLVLCVGLFIGMIPEHIHFINLGRFATPRHFATFDFDEMAFVLGRLPDVWRELLTGYKPSRSIADFVDYGLGQNAVIFLSIAAMAALVYLSKKRDDLKPAVALVALSLFAFLRVDTQYTEIAPARYLLPLTPALVLGIGALWHIALSSHKARYYGLALTLLCIGSMSHQILSRVRLTNHISQHKIIEQYHETIATFRKTPVRVVVSDDFWYANQLGVSSGGNPYFWASWRDWGVPAAKELAHSEKRVGIILKAKDGISINTITVDLLGIKWTLKPLLQLGDRLLFIGQR